MGLLEKRQALVDPQMNYEMAHVLLDPPPPPAQAEPPVSLHPPAPDPLHAPP
ncbi:hypothetical protein A2U01_0046488, partial [Trifolium medium]|nr:hypothetical protein [Trifolium medium]